MYICANCGVAFDGKVCPNCMTMRPSAAVIAGSGSILKKRTNTGMAPGQHAAQFAHDVELSKELDARRQARQEHNLRMRRRAAELAAAQERQQARKAPPVQPHAEVQAESDAEKEPIDENYSRNLQKAVGWKRKAPGTRFIDFSEEESDVVVPDAFRTLKINSAKQKQAVKPAEASVTKKAQKTSGIKAENAENKSGERPQNIPPVPSPGSNVSLPKGSAWEKTPNAKRIDAAWRLFAQDRAAAMESDKKDGE